MKKHYPLQSIAKSFILLFMLFCGTHFGLAKEQDILDTERNYGSFLDEINNHTVRAYLHFRSKIAIISHSLYFRTPKGLLKSDLQKNINISTEILNSLFLRYKLTEIKKDLLNNMDKYVSACLKYQEYISCYGFDEKNDFGIITFIKNEKIQYIQVDKEMIVSLKKYLSNEVFRSEIAEKEKIIKQILFGE